MGENVEEVELDLTLQPSKDVVFESLMRNYGQQVIRLVYLLVRDRALSEDITQEVFLKAYKGLDSFRGESNLKTWIYRIAVNESKSYLRSWSFRNIFSTWLKDKEKKLEALPTAGVEPLVMHRLKTEEMIRQLAYGSKRRQRFAPLFAGWSMAAVLAIIVALPWIGPANIRKVETKPPSAEVSEQAVQAVLQRMYNALPELKAYKLETVSQTSILLRKDAAQTANIQFDQADREIEWFQINTVGQSAGQKPSMSLAKGRAADFLSKVLGGVSQQYRAMSAVDAAFGKQIMFQRYLHGLPVLWDTVEVVVNAEGKVVSYNGLDRLKDLPLFGAPDPTEAIGQKQAIQEMTSKMKLRYIENLPAASDPITGQAKTRILLEYSPGTIPYSEENRLTADWFIDAATGKLETMLGEPGQSFAFAPPKEYVKVKNAEDAARLIESVYQIKVNPQELKAGKSNRPDIQSLLYAPGTDHEIEIAFYKESGVIKALLTKQRQVERKVSEAEALKAAVRFWRSTRTLA